ncbi:MAG: hypothetical protein ABIG34_02255 [Candidatus Peregrinibacteria bacterium]
MASQFFRKVMGLELEEKILNAGALVAIVGVFLPWIGGEQLGGTTVSYTGFGFYTGIVGISVFALHLFVLLITIIPLTGGPVLIRRRYREVVRLCATAETVILILSCLSVLIKVTFDLARMEIRFGIYVALIGSLVALFESFLRFQEQRKGFVQELFHHPEEQSKPVDKQEFFEAPPPPPPPPPLPPEEHRIHR